MKIGTLTVIFPLLLLTLVIDKAKADFYVAGQYALSQIELYKGVDDAEGSGFVGTLGYKFGPFSVEGFYKGTDYDQLKYRSAAGNEVQVDLENRILGVGGRLTVLFFLDLKGGVAYHDIDLTAKEGATNLAVKGDGANMGYYAGIGGRIPLLGFMDIFADGTTYYADDLDQNFYDIEGGLRVYF